MRRIGGMEDYMRKRLLGVLLAAATVASVFAGCGSKDTSNDANNDANNETKVEDVSLKVWVPENQIKTGTIASMCDSFKALHPEWNITFTVEAVGEDTCKDEVLKDVEAAADVFFFANDQLAALVDAGAIAKLGGSTENMVKTTMAPAVVDTVTYNGSIYAIPFTHNTFFMFYDKTLLNEEDVKTVEGIMAKPLADNAYNFYFESAGGWKLGAWYYGAGCTVYGESGTDYAKGCDWNQEKGIAVTNYLIDLINNPKCAYDGDISVSELCESHRIGAWFDGSWMYDTYKKVLGDNLGLAVIPTFNPDGNDYQLKSFYGSKAIGVNAHASNMAAAVAFAAYLGGEEMQLQRYVETAQVPTNITAGNSEAVQKSELASVIVAESNTASVMQPVNSEFSSRYWTYAGAIATEIHSGEINKSNVKEKLTTFVNAMKVE